MNARCEWRSHKNIRRDASEGEKDRGAGKRTHRDAEQCRATMRDVTIIISMHEYAVPAGPARGERGQRPRQAGPRAACPQTSLAIMQ